MRTNKRTFAAAQIVPQTILAPLDLAAIFGHEGRLEVDLGCGDGSFLVELAAENPATNFLGIERLPGRVRSACRKIGNRSLTNARILAEDILYSMQQLLPPGSVDCFYLMFPDPWPKRRHHNRRTMNESFLRAAARALKPAGEIQVATDHGDYFAAIQVLLQNVEQLAVVMNNHSLGKPATTFEKYYRDRGVEIQRLTLRKLSEDRKGITS